MKIKTKKQLNLPQLIEWLLESGKSECIVISNMNNIVQLEPYGVIRFSQEKFYPEEIFTVEVEEEITEDTKLDLLLDHFINPYGQHYVGNIYRKRSINDVLEENDEMEIATNSIHLFDIETNEFKLIWRDGKLVE
ncbi:hypothetical protein [Staphylococcus equorum]|uniref:hypothetical protein n=1 Tax=Staphylococcus equorum TaxID=246432 RepID=UPI0025533551|nr:hypothetical protein [Staphylococcus equorum]MDK9870249.1 hypothetical protein [Staphylococcus equorum]